MNARVLLRAIAGKFGYTFRGALCIKYVNWGYQNNDQSVSLIPKRDSGIPGLQFLNPGFRD